MTILTVNDGSKIPHSPATLGIVVSSPAKRKFSSNLGFRNQAKDDTEENKLKKLKKRHQEPSFNLTANQKQKKRILYLGGSQTKLQTSYGTFSLRRITEDVNYSGQSSLVKCHQCNREVKQKSYKSHLKTHLGLKKYECELCGDKFTRRNDVKRHSRLIHEKPRDFQCEVCQKYFVSDASLKSHISKHETEFLCLMCSHKFEKKEHYEDHVKILHPSSQENLVTNYKSQKLNKSGPKRKKRSGNRRQSLPNNCPTHSENKSLVDKVSGLGQLVEKEDGTFEVVNHDREDDSGENSEVTDESPDAVQTLINAVQELIQTHEESVNESSSKSNKI